MSDGVVREWRFYLDDMIGFAEKVIAYTNGLDQSGFVVSELNYDATVRNLELIGKPQRISRRPFATLIRTCRGGSSSPHEIA